MGSEAPRDGVETAFGTTPLGCPADPRQWTETANRRREPRACDVKLAGPLHSEGWYRDVYLPRL